MTLFQNGKRLKRGPMNIPGDLKGKWFVLFSHPADFTPVCTTEFVAFQKRSGEYECYDWWFCHKPLEE